MGEEIWKDIANYEGLYQVSNFGRVKSFNGLWIEEKNLKPELSTRGYLRIELFKCGKGKHYAIHRLVAKAFIPNPNNKPQVNHINGIKTDNCVENLEWATNSENTRHAFETGLRKSGEGNSLAKLTNEQAKYIRENPEDLTQKQLAKKFGVTQNTISLIQRGVTYKNAGESKRKVRTFNHIANEQRAEIRNLYNMGKYSQQKLAELFNVTQPAIHYIIHEND